MFQCCTNLPAHFNSFRYYIGVLREETLVGRLSNLLNAVKAHDFQVVSIEPHVKDGGVFVKFQYNDQGGTDAALNTIIRDLKESTAKHGGIPSWVGIQTGNAWIVKGKPWKEVRIFPLCFSADYSCAR